MAVPPATHASVVFLKVQEFARRPASEQARLRAQLEAVVAVVIAELDAAKRIVLEAADGSAIVVLADPAGALRLAQRALTAVAAGLPLAAGVHHGAVQLAAGGRGGRGEKGMAGDGIAVAASVAGFAVPPRLLASRAFRDAVAEAAPGTEAQLVAAGTFSDAGLRPHELFSPDVQAVRRRELRYLVAGAVMVVALLGAGVATRVAAEGQQRFVQRLEAAYRGAATTAERALRALLVRARF